MRFLLAMAIVCLVAAFAICPAWAALVTLTDGNSLFQMDPTTEIGASVWRVDGVDHMFMAQWFYRLGTGGTVRSINQLGTPAVTPYFGTQGVSIMYSPAGYTVTLGYTLVGGYTGSGTSDIGESFLIKNTGTTALSFDLFEYSDFDLQPYGSNDYAQHIDANTITQWDGVHSVTETVVRTPDRWQISAPFAITGDLSNSSASIGPTDCAWAFQWNLLIQPGSTVVFSKNKAFTLVPEPSSLVALGTCLAGMCAFRRRR